MGEMLVTMGQCLEGILEDQIYIFKTLEKYKDFGEIVGITW